MTGSSGIVRLARRAGELTSLWRQLSLRNRSHLVVLGFSGLASGGFLVFQILDGGTLLEAVPPAVNFGVMLFLAWAIAREIDPDFPRSALVAAGAAAAILPGGSAPAGTSVALLLALRIVTRSPGKAPTLPDLVILPLLSAVVAWTPRGWLGGAAVAVALVVDARMPDPAGRRNYAGAVAVAVAALAVALSAGTLRVGFTVPTPLGWAALAGGLLAFPAMRRYVPQSVQDRSGSRITPGRLRAGRLIALGTGAAGLGLFGGAAAPLLAGMWASFVGVAAYHRLIAPGSER